MKLLEAKIRNFRLLHNVEIKFDHSSTSIVGKNNSGKTSLTSIFKIFLSKGSIFSFDDFSLKSYEDFKKLFEEYLQIDEENKEEVLKSIQQKIPKIQLILDIEFSEEDNWNLLKPFFISLEEEQKIKILCEYSPEFSEKFLKTLKKYYDRDVEKKIDIIEHIRVIYSDHYKIKIRPYSDSIAIIPDSVRNEDFKSLLNVCFINAQRTLDDSNIESKSKLSKIFHEHFSKQNEKDETMTEELLNSISLTALTIDEELKTFFSQYIDHFRMFGFPGVSNEEIELRSDLNPENLFRNNIKLYYNNEGKILPEKYNGLGYSNLIFIISQIIGFYNAIRENNSCLNLIFIEEPEAHMHPQMQIVFNKNITGFLNKMGLTAQTIITTHSSHILASSKFSSVKYFTKLDNVSSKVKDLMDFSSNLREKEKLKFLEQYLTLGKCDLFFSDKAIFFEGTVERILMPIFMEKVDSQSFTKLAEQYITSIEVGGAYMNMFQELLEFLELKTLIITDIDSIDSKKGEKSEVQLNQNQKTSNATLKKWMPCEGEIDKLLNENTIREKNNIKVAYQTLDKERKKCGRSFEEAFILENYKYIFSQKDSLLSIRSYIQKFEKDSDVFDKSYAIQEYIDRNKKKTDFTFDLLSVEKDEWVVPSYIKEGLVWLAQ